MPSTIPFQQQMQGRLYTARSSWHFSDFEDQKKKRSLLDFRCIFLPNKGEVQVQLIIGRYKMQ